MDEEMLPGDSDLFVEPDDYYVPAKEGTEATHTLLSGGQLTVSLVGHNPLWVSFKGHLLWNAGRVVSTYLERRSESLVKDSNVLELGAGAGLPSLVCAISGAKIVVVTDYPDSELVENLRQNIARCKLLPAQETVYAEGYLWGAPCERLTSHIEDPEKGFDLLILADLLFNHSEHAKLLLTVQKTLKRSSESKALVFFTPYRPWLLEKDLAFFDLAREGGFTVQKVLEYLMDKVMFEEDRGDETQRRTVYGYELQWKDVP
ncbi:MAG: hypothetical protein M4579_002079 [Chaenotheca gracillima]|nr:MAG: hypothetical protein M4579_002079 [Chaenotheca gracillima]